MKAWVFFKYVFSPFFMRYWFFDYTDLLHTETFYLYLVGGLLDWVIHSFLLIQSLHLLMDVQEFAASADYAVVCFFPVTSSKLIIIIEFFLYSNNSALHTLPTPVPNRSSHQRCSVKKVFLEISQNSQENTCARVSFLITLLKKRPWHRCFPVNFVKFLTGRLFLLYVDMRWLHVLLFFCHHLDSMRSCWLSLRMHYTLHFYTFAVFPVLYDSSLDTFYIFRI